jgi:hypothetical protein
MVPYAPRMRYKWFRSRGLFTGSGAVATLRCQQASRSEDQICYAARNQMPAA